MNKYLPALASAALLAGLLAFVPRGEAENASPDPNANPTNESIVLRDPQIPVLGNPQGDITIVEYFDYRCPYCKKSNPDLVSVVREDGHTRLVFKDWPIFGGVSIYAAKLALASKYQNKLAQAHEALISAKQNLSQGIVDRLLTGAGIDLTRAKRDLAAHREEIDAILARNDQQAQAFGFRGTPAFIIGHFRVQLVLDAAMFKHAMADARAAAKQNAK
jgi:protein-disulfide isomerase